MSFGLSVVVTIPSSVEESAVISIGERYDPTNEDAEPMGIGEAVQFAFMKPGGVADLARLGVTWEVYEVGGKS